MRNSQPPFARSSVHPFARTLVRPFVRTTAFVQINRINLMRT